MSFVHAAASNVLRLRPERPDDKLPLRTRTLLIAGGAAGLWVILLVAGYYLVDALL